VYYIIGITIYLDTNYYCSYIIVQLSHYHFVYGYHFLNSYLSLLGLPCITREVNFGPGTQHVMPQVTVPANTIIEGVSNPNDAGDKTRKPDYAGWDAHGISFTGAPVARKSLSWGSHNSNRTCVRYIEVVNRIVNQL
jgi:hypothetical protein